MGKVRSDANGIFLQFDSTIYRSPLGETNFVVGDAPLLSDAAYPEAGVIEVRSRDRKLKEHWLKLATGLDLILEMAK